MSLDDQFSGADRSALFVDRGTTAGAGILFRMLRRMSSQFQSGRLIIQMPTGQRIEHAAKAPGPEATLILHNWRTIRELIVRGDIGFAEAFMGGDWSTPDLTALIEWASRNLDALERTITGFYPMRLLNKLRHARRANTTRRSRYNISAHYDLGNDFYASWLDPSMSYSSAIFADPDQSLEAAQRVKRDRVIDRLGLSSGEHVLEIGCGWGAVATELAERHGCRVTGLTLSQAQLDYAKRQIDGAGLSASADLRLQDYREVTGTFDRIVSIEMIEAVGQKYWPTYFDVIRERLRPGGVAVVQAITIAESRFESYSRNPDFIQRYIFPGGMLPSREAIRQHVARAGLVLRSEEMFGPSYARTLAEWRRRFQQAWPSIKALGFDMQFKRMWEYYLAYCEAGFRTAALDVGLYSIVRPLEGTS